MLRELEETLRVELVMGVSQVGGECLEAELATARGLGGVAAVKLGRVHTHAVYQRGAHGSCVPAFSVTLALQETLPNLLL